LTISCGDSAQDSFYISLSLLKMSS